MPQATTLRLVRGGSDRTAVPNAAYALLSQHIAHTDRITALATSIASDAEILVEALRYFTVAPPHRRAS